MVMNNYRILEVICVVLSLVSGWMISGETKEGRHYGFILRGFSHSLWSAYNIVTCQYFILIYSLYVVFTSIRGLRNNGK